MRLLSAVALLALPPLAGAETFTVGSAHAERGRVATGMIEVPAAADPATSIPVIVVHGARPGKVLAIVAGAHGTEYASIVAVERLIGRVDPSELSGTVILVPLVNRASFDQKVVHVNPVDGKSMNRFYPGRADGTQTERASYLITKEVVERCDHLIDLHGGDLDESLRPYAYWTPTGREEQDRVSHEMVLAFGLDHIIVSADRPKDPAASRYLENTATTRGKPSLTAEAGHAGTVEPEDVDALVRGCLGVMRYLEMLPGAPDRVENPVWIDRVLTITSDEAGLFYPRVKRGAYVAKGTAIGDVTDFFGRKVFEARAPAAGVVLYICSVPSMTKGGTIANVGVVRPGATRAQDPPGGGIKSVGCAAMASLRLPDVRITEAVAVNAGQPPGGSFKKAHCRVAGVIGREIRFEVLLPDAWNQRFFMGGGGGFVGAVVNHAAGSVNAGFATAGTDTGHQAPSSLQAGWALDDLERQLNFGHLAVHRTAAVAKAIVRAYYGSDASRSYFIGCSRGGGQALMEAQRYPDDFDGIVAGAPALDWPGIAAAFVKNSQAAFPDPATLSHSVITRENLKLLEEKIVAACDANDGVKDGVMEDPRDCAFKVGDIPACADDRPGPECLTRAQRAAIERIYAPTVTQDGTIYYGQPFGGEGEAAGWQNWITGVNEGLLANAGTPSLQWAFGSEFFKYFVFHDASWDYSKYDLSTWKRDTRLVATFMNATNPDLAAFKAAGRKLLLWHGWSDPALSALATIGYYQQVEARDPAVRDYFRMFLLPGVLHCDGGPGPDTADWYTTIADWVERGQAPDRLVVTRLGKEGKVTRARALCPYPQRSVYLGTGSTDVAESYACKAP